MCLRLGVIPVMVEHVASGNRDTVEAALSLIDEAKVYIGIFGHTYGNIPPGYDKSISEMEYDRALERGIPRLVVTTSEGRPPETIEVDVADGAAKLEAFIDRVKKKQVVSQVESPKEFRSLLIDGLAALRINRVARRVLKTPPEGASERKKGGGDGKAKATQPKIPTTNKYNQVLRVFVASPKDVQDERSRMPKVVDSLNKTLGKLLSVTIELWRWEVDALPSIGEPQALINVELDDADVVLVIFWNRFGTPTSEGTTGTESEVLRTLEHWSKARQPQVMIYFCQRPARLDRTDLEQRLKLLDFRERISSLVLAVDYEEAQEFEWRVRDDLFTTIARLCVKHK